MKLELSGYISAPTLPTNAKLKDLKNAGLLEAFADDVSSRDPEDLFYNIEDFPEEIAEDREFLEYLSAYVEAKIKDETIKFAKSDFDIYEEYDSYGWDYSITTDINVEKIYKEYKKAL